MSFRGCGIGAVVSSYSSTSSYCRRLRRCPVIYSPSALQQQQLRTHLSACTTQQHKIRSSGVVVARTATATSTALVSPQRRNMTSSSSSSFNNTNFHFATSEYAACFQNLPQPPDASVLRASTLEYLQSSFDSKLWYNDPIVSLVNGEKIAIDGNEIEIETVNALGQPNGRQLLASPEQVASIKDHIRSIHHRHDDPTTTTTTTKNDLRQPIRQIEQLLLSSTSTTKNHHVGYLIGNQMMDFQKQDGITEIVEAITANTVERRLNDMLLQEEMEHRVCIHRKPIYVGTVSNFTNFLDLSRKVLRSLEVGIPVIVLGRTNNTQQHSYRWVQLLVDLCIDAQIDPKMVTFLSCSIDDIQSIVSSCQNETGRLYITSSRSVASTIQSYYPRVVASTGGPNTLVCTTHWDHNDNDNDTQNGVVVAETNDDNNNNINQMKNAIATSAAIESAGQCTALRHCVIPTTVSDTECLSVFDNLQPLDRAETALTSEMFTGVFSHPATVDPPTASGATLPTEGAGLYQKHGTVDAYYMVRPYNDLPSGEMNEYWRKVAVDFSKLDLMTESSHPSGRRRQIDMTQIQRLAGWLNTNQPIALAVNGPRSEALLVGLRLWERTALVVNTIGSIDDPDMPPAMTCQARPQEGEIFGEFPPRQTMNSYTTYPVLIPSSNPSYDTVYNTSYLQSRGEVVTDYMIKSTRALVEAVQSIAIRGYCIILIEYLQNVARLNPKPGYGTSRTVLWGIQCPPLGSKTVVRCDGDDSMMVDDSLLWDRIAPIYLLFHATTARDQIELSIDPKNTAFVSFCQQHKLPHVIETDDVARERRSRRNDVFHWISAAELPVWDNNNNEWPMAGNFASLYLPMGHIKSTKPNDEEFILQARLSPKWLNTLF